MSNQLPEPVQDFLDAVNRHDPNALNAFAPDAWVDDWGRKFTGLQAITAWSNKEFLGSHGTVDITQVTYNGDAHHGGSVTVSGEWDSNFANGPSTFTFTLDGDKIASMTIREG